MGQQWDQGRNQKIPWEKWKWKHKDPKFMGHSESSPKREIHSNTGLPKETRKSQMNSLSLHLREWKKEQQNKPKWEQGRK